MKKRKKYRKSKDLIKSAINKAIEYSALNDEEKLADYILRLNKIKLPKPDLKKILQNLHNFQK